MPYVTEVFKTREERNQRNAELKLTHKDVVIWSNPVKVGFDEKTLKSIYETQWIVGYPPQLIETVEQLAEEIKDAGQQTS